MKPKSSRRLILLLTFMLARRNVLGSVSCLSGCQHSEYEACTPTDTGCSDGEVCSRFEVPEFVNGKFTKFEDVVLMQCMTKEDCKTNKEASETDLMETVINLKTFTDAKMLSPGGKIEFACCDQNDCNSKKVSEMKIDQVEANGAERLFENYLMFYMALSLTFICFSS